MLLAVEHKATVRDRRLGADPSPAPGSHCSPVYFCTELTYVRAHGFSQGRT